MRPGPPAVVNWRSRACRPAGPRPRLGGGGYSMNGWLRLAHGLLQDRPSRCAPDRSCRHWQGRAWLCRARGAGSDGDVERCVPLLPLRPVVQAECPPLLSLFLSGSSSRSALTGNGSNCTCHADTTGLKQGTLGRDARDCWDPQSSVTACAATRSAGQSGLHAPRPQRSGDGERN